MPAWKNGSKGMTEEGGAEEEAMAPEAPEAEAAAQTAQDAQDEAEAKGGRKRGRKKGRKKGGPGGLFYYISPANFKAELSKYAEGVEYSKTLAMRTLVMALLTMCVSFGFKMKWFLWPPMLVVTALFLPAYFVYSFKFEHEKRRFLDASSYMGQVLRSFHKTGRVLTSLKDIAPLYKDSPLGPLLEEAAAHIENDYSEDSDTELEALELIERAYDSDKLRMIHRFLLKVEALGGNFDKTLELLHEDRDAWESRILENRVERVKKKNIVIASIIASTMLCMLMMRLTSSSNAILDYSGNIVAQLTVIVVWLVDCVVFTSAHKALAVDLLNWENDEDPEQAVRLYQRVAEYDPHRGFVQSLALAAGSAAAGLAVFLVSVALHNAVFRYLGIGLLILAVPMLFQHRLGHQMAVDRVKRSVERTFPRWLMDVALLLQSENVQVAIQKSYFGAPEILKPALEDLVADLADDPTGVDPYLSFLSEYEIDGTREAMKMLYSISAGLGEDPDEQIHDIIQQNYEMQDKAERTANENALSYMYMLFAVPIFVGGGKMLIDMVLVFFQALTSYGEYIGG